MIELAPRHKFGLPIQVPVMPASGAFGYGDAYRDMVNYASLGAVVTNPVSYSPRRAAGGTRISTYSDSMVVHTGHPNPGVRVVIRDYHQVWERMPVPVIVHLLATTPEETAKAAGRLAGRAGVRGLELGLAENTSNSRVQALIDAVKIESDLPVIVRVPFSRVDALVTKLARYGADAITLTAPPRAVLPGAKSSATVASFVRGRLYGPAVYPMLLNVLSRWARKAEVPVIACGGITTAEEALTCLSLGAAAVQIDAVLWKDPSILNQIASALMEPALEVDDISALTAPKTDHEDIPGMDFYGFTRDPE